MTTDHTTEKDVICPCGHSVNLHSLWGCDAYVRPRIGGSGACCTRTPAEVFRAVDTSPGEAGPA